MSSFEDQELSNGAVKSMYWKARWFPVTMGDIMSTEIFWRAKEGIYYANVTYIDIRLRDLLKTVNRDEAQRRLIELKLAAEILVLV